MHRADGHFGRRRKAPDGPASLSRSRECQPACKPGSVGPEAGLRTWRPFLWDGRCRPPLATNPDDGLEAGLAPQGRRVVPIRFCSWWGLPCRPRCRVRGALLPHPFTLTPSLFAVVPRPDFRSGGRGGLLSVALSLGSPPPDVVRHRVSLEPGLSSPPAMRTERPPGRLTGFMWRRSNSFVKSSGLRPSFPPVP